MDRRFRVQRSTKQNLPYWQCPQRVGNDFFPHARLPQWLDHYIYYINGMRINKVEIIYFLLIMILSIIVCRCCTHLWIPIRKSNAAVSGPSVTSNLSTVSCIFFMHSRANFAASTIQRKATKISGHFLIMTNHTMKFVKRQRTCMLFNRIGNPGDRHITISHRFNFENAIPMNHLVKGSIDIFQ